MTEQEKQAEIEGVKKAFRALFYRYMQTQMPMPIEDAAKEMKAWGKVENLINSKIKPDAADDTK